MQIPASVAGAAQSVKQSVASAVSPIRSRTQAFLMGIPSSVPGSIQRTASQAGGIVPGAMEAFNMPGKQAVRSFQSSKGNLGNIPGLTASRALGYGTMAVAGIGALGTGAVVGAEMEKRKQRLAGQQLGAQLGVGMPPAY